MSYFTWRTLSRFSADAVVRASRVRQRILVIPLVFFLGAVGACGGGGGASTSTSDSGTGPTSSGPTLGGPGVDASIQGGVSDGSNGSDGVTTPASSQPSGATPSVISGVANVIGVVNGSGGNATNTPVQVGRAFRAGEIKTCPGVDLGGMTLPYQADVKTRYADGSVKFAVVSAVVPTLANGGATNLRFFDRGSCPAAGTPDVAGLLGAYPRLDAVVSLNAGAAGTASARAMLAAGKYTVWTHGPVQTTLIVADHQSKQYDLGTDANKSLRPLFHVQIWHALQLVKVRVIVEQADAEKIQNQSYGVEVKAGRDSLATVYQNATVGHTYASRWTRSFWLGGTPAEFDLKHGVEYLASTYAIPNYDGAVTLSSAAKQNQLTLAGGTRTLYGDGGGAWTKYMPTTGGRPDIGLFPEWQVAALYDGDARLWRSVLSLSDLAGAWPVHFREGGGRNFSDTPAVAGKGLPLTLDGRPTLFYGDGNGYLNSASITAPADQVKMVGSTADNGWVPDAAHQPDPWYLPYLVTGDYWYLEQLQFWAAWNLFTRDPNNQCWGSGRSPKDGSIYNQVRGEAWILRGRARAAWASPDGSPEQAYFKRVLENALRAKEGRMIGGGSGNVVRDWWASQCAIAGNPLRFWDYGGTAERGGASDEYSAIPSWQVWFLVASLGHVKELGFSAGPLFSWLAQYPIGMATTNYLHMADYRTPTQKNATGYPFYQSWQDVFDSWPGWSQEWASSRTDLSHGYATLATAATSFVTAEPGGPSAWSIVNSNNYSTQSWGINPKWAIKPR